MATDFVSVSLPVGAWLRQSNDPASFQFPFQDRASGAILKESRFGCNAIEDLQDRDEAVWRKMLEAMPQGVLVLSRLLQVIFVNAQAERLCTQLREPNESSEGLPIALIELCQRFLQEEGAIEEFMMMEYQGQQGELLRSQVRWLDVGQGASPFLLVLIEDCQATLCQERILEQKKYDLTDREAEVWILLRQDYTYQEISSALNISMNTVKTHVKNVYAKRKNLMGKRKVWFSR